MFSPLLLTFLIYAEIIFKETYVKRIKTKNTNRAKKLIKFWNKHDIVMFASCFVEYCILFII